MLLQQARQVNAEGVESAVLRFYNLAEQPFGVSPDPRYFFLSLTHREALASAVCSVSAGRGFTALIAKPGMGKTTLLFDLLNRVKDQAKTAFLFQAQCSPRDLLGNLLEDLEIKSEGMGIAQMQRKLNECLLSEARQGRQLVVVIDEAQNLDDAVLEVVRMLSNFEKPHEKLIHFVLAGQPQLAEKLASPSMLQLRQRISIIARLNPFTPEETQLYIHHRLGVAGFRSAQPMFTKEARGLIAEYSEGIPRNINNVCFNALSLGFVAKQKTIDAKVIREARGDLDLRPMLPEPAHVAKSEQSQKSTRALVTYPMSWSGTTGWPKRLALAFALILAISGGLFVWTRHRTINALASPPFRIVRGSETAPITTPVTMNAEHGEASAPGTSILPSTDLGVIVVQPNQTLYRIIVENFGVYNEMTLARVRELNPWLTDASRIEVGQRIRLPYSKGTSRKMIPTAQPNVGTADKETRKP